MSTSELDRIRPEGGPNPEQGTSRAAARVLSHRVVAFCRALRRAGVKVGVGDGALALAALDAIDPLDRDEVCHALRIVLARRREEQPIFDQLFAAWFDSRGLPLELARAVTHEEGPDGGEAGADPASLALAEWGGEAPEEAESAETASYSPAERLAQKDFADLSEDDLSQVERLVAALARQLATRQSRRWRPARRGERPDLRRTLRRSLSTLGEPLTLTWRRRTVSRHRAVVLLDVSRSMELYSRFLMQLLHALQVRMRHVESFVFSTRLTRVTPWLRRTQYRTSLRELGRQAAGWAGGTRIGESLDQFVAQYGPRLMTPRTVVIILSDGWDMGEPALMDRVMGWIRRHSAMVIWLNPLLGSPGYRPETRGMKAALPHLDVFAPCHNVASLRRLTRLLARP